MIEEFSLKVSSDDFEIEYEILPLVENYCIDDPRKQAVADGLNTVNNQLSLNQQKMEELNKGIERLTNRADGIDYMAAVGSGILAGLVDSLWVGKFDFGRGKAWSNKQVNQFVMKAAKSKGYTGKRLDGAIKHLEKKFPVPNDNLWKGRGLGISARSHHLDDMAHHPSPIGLFFSILTQFTKQGYFQNSEGSFFPISIDESGKGLIGADFPSKIFAGTVNWFFHLVSDMSGSNKTAGVGMGIPGPIISLVKEMSAIPGVSRTGLANGVKNAFGKSKFDLRGELALGHELARQAIPVVMNEVIVRSFYFVRRLYVELKEKGDLGKVNWKNTLPWRNRTIIRMLTIATGTFTLIDLADAAIRAGLKSGGQTPLFVTEFLLRVNFVGVGRFALAVGADVNMGVKRSKLRSKRIALFSEQLHMIDAKVYYLQAGMWVAAETTGQTIDEAFVIMKNATIVFQESVRGMSDDFKKIAEYIPSVTDKNPTLLEEMNEILEWE